MAETRDDGGGAGGGQQSLNVLMQYVKDFSFESPGAPETLRGLSSRPEINIQIDVGSSPTTNDQVEVQLKINVRALLGQTNLFAVELVYAGVFQLTNIPPESVRPLTLIECPRLLFPFARQIIADAIRSGGFPTLLIDPVDFVSLYRQRIAEEQSRRGNVA